MPEMKRNFTSGKMNKDFDTRLVPPGEYRHGLNIQVSTSDGSRVGTVQNILGNTPGCNYTGQINPIPTSAKTVGSISDEKNDSLYWFVAGFSNILDFLPLQVDETKSLKDIIMRTNSNTNVAPSGCEPVFVDQYGWGVGVDDNSPPANYITFSGNIPGDPYSNVNLGMHVTGYSGVNLTFGPTLVTNQQGTLVTLPDINYSVQENAVSVIVPDIILNNDILVRTFEQYVKQWLCTPHTYNFTALEPAPCETGPFQTNIPAPGLNQFWIDPVNWSQDIVVGSTISSVFNSVTGANILNGITDAEIVDITYQTLCENLQPGQQGGCFQAYVLTIDTNGAGLWVGALDQNSNTYGLGEAHSFKNFDAVISPPAINKPIPSEVMNIPPGNDSLLASIYNTLWTNPNTPTGYQLKIDENYGSGSTWPPNSCIDPNSVIDGANFNPPVSYDDSFLIVDCDNGAVNVALNFNGANQPVRFEAIEVLANIPEAVFLDEPVDLSTSDTICFTSEKVLEFDAENSITGINIVDDMLFWTDNFSEPKKINITRSLLGTNPSGNIHTSIINQATGINNHPIKKDHITVIRKGPKNSLSMELRSSRDPNKNYTGVIQISDTTSVADSSFWDQRGAPGPAPNAAYPYDFSSITTEEGSNVFRVIIDSDINLNPNFNLNDWKVGAKVVLKEFDADGTPPSIPIVDYTIKGTITDWIFGGNDVNSFTSSEPSWGAKVAIKVDSISGTPKQADETTNGILKYAIDLFDESERLFEFKLPRFSYRYKYEDGEYSTFAPWTKTAFLPGNFDYHPNKGYNLGMTNRLTHLFLRDFITDDLPVDVVEIDLLYKEESSPNIYVVETLKPNSQATITNVNGSTSNNWALNEFRVDHENIKTILPSNQLLRAWDTVPRTALAQEITGNRLVYGNYTQNYDLTVGGVQYNPDLSNCKIINDISSVTSIKSLREYQLGVVFTDKYGRETPVISNSTGHLKVNKDQSSNKNKLQLNIRSSAIPMDMEYYRFYVKETSGEYYNMAMDRYWDAEDGNVWVSFASSDINKIDLDSVLILKKGVDSDKPVIDPAKFKVLAIQNEAPEFIKLNKSIISDRDHQQTNPPYVQNIFLTGDDELPKSGNRSFALSYYDGPNSAHVYSNSGIKNIHNQSPLEGDIYFQITNNERTQSSKPIKIAKIDITDDNWNNVDGSNGFAGDIVKWEITLEEPFGNDINKFTDDINGNNSTKIMDGNRAVFWNYKKENSAEFDGRFFVKIYKDTVFQENIINNSAAEITNFDTVIAQKIYSFDKGKHSIAWNNASAVDPVIHPSYPVNNEPPEGVGGIIGNGLLLDPGAWEDYFAATDWQGTYENATSGVTWREHAAFFRGINVHKSEPTDRYDDTVSPAVLDGFNFGNHGFNSRKDFGAMDLHMENGGHSWDFEDVWFVDGEISQGQHQGVWGENYSNTQHVGAGIDLDNGYLELGFGGIQPAHVGGNSDWYWSRINTGWVDGGDPDFYDLSNNNHYSQNANRLAEKLNPGTFFRWKDDPTGQIFRVTDLVGSYNLLRHEAGNDIDAEQWRAATGLNSTMPSFNGISYTTSTFFRPDNYSKNYKLTFTDHLNPNAPINWNPYNIGSPITNGLDMRLTANGASQGSNNCEIKVDTLIGTNLTGNSNYDDRSVEVGMVVYKINTTVETAVISKIDAASNTLYLKQYDPDDIGDSFAAVADNQYVYVAQYGMNGLSRNSAKNINYFNQGVGFSDTNVGVDAVGYDIEILEPEVTESFFPRFPAIFETEPKEGEELDIYYEITDNNPAVLNKNTLSSILPIGIRFNIQAVDSSVGDNGLLVDASYVLQHQASGHEILVFDDLSSYNIINGDKLTVKKPNGDVISLVIDDIYLNQSGNNSIIKLKQNLLDQQITSSWHNCYSFGNGVESNRIRDTFNQAFISNGVKASTTLSKQYKKEHRKYGLIYSGLYNSTSSTNNLNQFVQAEKITKEINPLYGSIQKLYSRSTADGDLITLCEDRVLKILANKDALYNADGSLNLVATENVLGQAVPFSGEYGISENPESFAAEAYRVYFADKVRGAIIRLSRDGLTPISDHGMKDWFRDNLKLSNKIVGSYDDRKYEYNITLHKDVDSTTLSFREDVRGWVSFKSFIAENAVSCANEYYTFKDGELWKHHAETHVVNGVEVPAPRNTFYGTSYNSSLKVVLNDAPSVVKSFYTLNYEGSQSKVDQLTSYNTYDPSSWDGTFTIHGTPNYNIVTNTYVDNEYYNDQAKNGWYVQSIRTNQEEGSLNEFIEKEGKWFNFIKGKQ